MQAYGDASNCSRAVPSLQICSSFFLHPTVELTSKLPPWAAATTSFTHVHVPPTQPCPISLPAPPSRLTSCPCHLSMHVSTKEKSWHAVVAPGAFLWHQTFRGCVPGQGSSSFSCCRAMCTHIDYSCPTTRKFVVQEHGESILTLRAGPHHP